MLLQVEVIFKVIYVNYLFLQELREFVVQILEELRVEQNRIVEGVELI